MYFPVVFLRKVITDMNKRGTMNPNQNNNLFSIVGRALRLLLALIIMSPTSVFANPYGGAVVAGLANLGNAGSVVTVEQLTDRAIINWNGFSINVGELTKFIQPNALSAVLNRVTGGDPSAIYGTLQANGQVFLINPNGIMVGPSGVVNAQSFMASTLDVVVGQFMAGGDLLFSGNSLASVKNAGKINALGGDVLLIAHNLVNTGEINAVQGTAAMAAGSEVLLKSAGNERVFVQAGNGAADVGVDQKGQIMAAAAELKAAGGNVYGLAINNEGVVRATGVENKGGRVFLTATGGSVVNAGEISATQGDKGGEVRVAADNITLKNGSLIDVSGQNGGGTALIGGDLHGANPDMPNAKNTTVEAGAVIKADAIESGNGGKVIVWSDNTTNFQGNISAQGGASNGDGGFAEVSGGKLAFNGLADLRAPNGETGTLLLDPYDLTIGDDTLPDNQLSGAYISNGTSSYLRASTLMDQLGCGAGQGCASVTVETGGFIGDGQPGLGDITVNSAITWSSGKNLTLSAYHDITVNAPITANGSGSLELTTEVPTTIYLNANITTTGGFQTYNGNVSLQKNEILTSNNGAITFEGTVDGGGNNLTINPGSGEVDFYKHVGDTSPLGALTVTGTGSTHLDNYSSGYDYSSVTTNGAQSYTGPVVLEADATLVSNSDSITFKDAVNTIGTSGGPYGLSTESAGDTKFEGAVGSALHPLTYLSSDSGNGGGIYIMGGSVVTSGDQEYLGPVSIDSTNAALTSSGGNIRFYGTLDALNGTGLTTESFLNTEFMRPVGQDSPLSYLTANVTGVDSIYIGGGLGGGYVKTTGAQRYEAPVVIAADTTLLSTADSLTFLDTIDSANSSGEGPYGLITHSAKDTIFIDVIGGGSPLKSLQVNIDGFTDVDHEPVWW